MRLIDADELIEIAHRIRLDSRERIEQMIESAPTVDPVKHGYWELSPFDGNWACSNCGNKPYHDNMKNMNYCPDCGYKMDEVKKKLGMRMLKADDLEQALREAGLAEVIKDDCSKCTSAWGVPIVDAEPVRHGRWINISISANEYEPSSAQCDLCGARVYNNFSSIINYCPNCGAKMGEDRDYEHAVEQLEHDMTFEPTYNPEDGSM